jgi:glycosyltransferase involved in cell wall biosynthesis
VHAHLHEGIAIGTALRTWIGVPLIADIQGSLSGELIDHGFLSKGTRAAAVVDRLERWLVGRPDRILASSRTGVELLLAQGVGRDRVDWLPDGADLERFHPLPRDRDLIRRFGLEGKRVVVFLGLLTEYQGVDTLLESLPLLIRDVPDAHFLIMGYPNEAWYHDRAKALFVERHITLTGRVAYDDAARYLALGSVAVSPKTSPTEANGKLLNYMACGLPTVATDTPVNRELLGDAGIYVPIRDARALATALAGILVDSDRQARIGELLRQRAVTEFSWPVLAGRLRTIYDQLISKARH